MRNCILPSLLIALLSGCQTNDALVAKNDDGYRCEQVKSIGSSIPQKRCSTRAERELIKADSKESLRNHQKAGVFTGNTDF
ncbi:hypothetical protein [Pseudoalteromonas aurantia]|uniref:Lipoprotein n=1 Tax=Pseudoalteromonas aurantia 208 TaxID=1314867 RepID=A0ABR9EDP1_9GAMM|nr:hypothetical protein [Pseudoalteromonas aurantia]MBE0369111.1 hypothetical protein [Pseudoalteromonas aurantia 208]